MTRRQTSIQRKLTSAIMGTTVTVLLLTVIGFVSYELVTFNRWMENYVGTLGQIIADNSTAALQFDNPTDARQTLSTVSIERHVVAAALYDTNGALFARWPPDAPSKEVPQRPEEDGFHYEKGALVFFLPVEDESGLGALYLRSDVGARRERWGPYAVIVSIVLVVSILVALLLSRLLQRGISQP